MFRSVLLDKELWTEHLKLDPVTGLDPPGIKIRAAQGMVHNFLRFKYIPKLKNIGLDAADYFVTGLVSIITKEDFILISISLVTGFGLKLLKILRTLVTTTITCILQVMIGDCLSQILKSEINISRNYNP